MQTAGAKAVSDARYRVEAGLLADEIMGQLWSDISNGAAYDGFDTATLNMTPPGAATALTPSTMPAYIEDHCATSQSTADLLCRWGYKAVATLPAGRAQISSVSAGIAGSPARTVTIVLNWTPPGQTEQRTHDLVSLVVDR